MDRHVLLDLMKVEASSISVSARVFIAVAAGFTGQLCRIDVVHAIIMLHCCFSTGQISAQNRTR
jgi:hypothetical protein